MIDLSVIIPAYNEEKRIGLTLQKTCDFLAQRSWNYEIIAVDDGSRDQTVRVIKEMALERDAIRVFQNGRNRGKGFSVRHGLEMARGRFIGFMDADYKTDIKALDEVMMMGASAVPSAMICALRRITSMPSVALSP